MINKRVPALLILIASFLVTTNLGAQNALMLSLQEAKDYALANSQTVKNALLDVQIAKKQIWETTAIGLPQASVSAQYQHTPDVPMFGFPSNGFIEKPYDIDPSTGFYQFPSQNVNGLWEYFYEGEKFPMGSKDNTNIYLNVSQLVFSGEYIVGLQASRVFLNISKQAHKKTTIDLEESISKSYYLVLIATENLKIMESSLKNIKKTLADITEMYKVGFTEDTDVDQLKLTVGNLENAKNAIERQVNIAKRLLKFQMGIDLNTVIVLTESLQSILDSVDKNSAMAAPFDVNNNIDYKIIETQEKISHLSLKRERSKYLPSLAAFWRHQEQTNAPDFNFSPPDVFGLNLEVPVFTSGMRNAKVKQAKLDLEKARNTKEQVAQSLYLSYIQSAAELNSAFEKYQNEKGNVNLSEKIYNKALVKYQEGIISSMELTQAQNQYFTTQTNYFNAILELLNSKTNLEKLLGE